MAQVARAEPTGPKSSFRYVAVGAGGRIVRGKIKATSEVDAQNLLSVRGLSPISLEKAPPMFSLEEALPSFFKVKPREVITFSRQLATLLDSGVSLLPALRLLHVQVSSSRTFRRVMEAMIRDLNAGVALSETFRRHPNVFSEIYIRTVAVGEATGNLQVILRELSNHIEAQETFGKQLKAALTYPTIVMVVGIGVAFILMTVVLPPLTTMFTMLKAELPPTTKILLAMSKFTREYQMQMLIGAGILIPAFIVYTKRPSGKRFMDRLRLNIPMMGPAMRMSELARLSRSMSMLINAGVTLQEILEVLPQTVGNILFREAIESVRRGLLLGQGLANPMSAQPIFPPLFLQMVRVGEESNTLESTLTVLSNFYASAAEEHTHALISMITPVATIAMAGFGGFIALSIIMPMYSMIGQF